MLELRIAKYLDLHSVMWTEPPLVKCLAHHLDSMFELRMAKYLDLHLFSLHDRVVIANIRASSL